MFSHLEPFEIVIFILGIIFFIILAFGVWQAIQKGRKVGWLLPFFAVAIVMMGFPAYKSITIAGVELTLQEAVASSERNPQDQHAKDSVQKSLVELGSVNPKDLDGRILVARAYSVLGQKQRAMAQVDSVLKIDPTHQGALQYRKRFEMELPHH